MRDLPVRRTPSAWRRPRRARSSEIVDHKRFYLNKKFFLGRLIAYLLLWTWLAQRFFGWSTDQDKTSALENTVAAQRFAPVGLVIFGVTLTFFAFDWFLSLERHLVLDHLRRLRSSRRSALFNMAIAHPDDAPLATQRSPRQRTVNVEHFHDMGKLLFGWIVFWSYIALRAVLPDLVLEHPRRGGLLPPALARQRRHVEGREPGARRVPLLRPVLVSHVAQHQAAPAAARDRRRRA